MEQITQLENELAQANKKKEETEKICSKLFNQVMNLNSKQQDLKEEISSLKSTCENLSAQVAEKDAMIMMLRNTVSFTTLRFTCDCIITHLVALS